MPLQRDRVTEAPISWLRVLLNTIGTKGMSISVMYLLDKS